MFYLPIYLSISISVSISPCPSKINFSKKDFLFLKKSPGVPCYIISYSFITQSGATGSTFQTTPRWCWYQTVPSKTEKFQDQNWLEHQLLCPHPSASRSSDSSTPVAVESPQLPAAWWMWSQTGRAFCPGCLTSLRALPCQELQGHAGLPWLLPDSGSTSKNAVVDITASHRMTRAGPPHSTFPAPLGERLIFPRPSLSGSRPEAADNQVTYLPGT